MYNWCSQRIYRGVFICWILPWRLTVRLWKWVEGPKRRGLSSNHQFAGANCQTSGEYFINKIWWRSKKQATLNFQKENPQIIELLLYICIYKFIYTYIYMSFCEICWDVFFWKLGPPKTNFPQGIMWPMIGKYLSSFAFRCGESVGFFLLPSNGDHQGLVTLPLDFLQFY